MPQNALAGKELIILKLIVIKPSILLASESPPDPLVMPAPSWYWASSMEKTAVAKCRLLLVGRTTEHD